VDRVLGVRRAPDGTSDYCIKVMGRSFRDLQWRSQAWLSAYAPGKLRGFRGRSAKDGFDDGAGLFIPSHEVAAAGVTPAGTFFPEGYLHPDRVVAVRAAGAEYLVKWRGLGYSNATWEHVSALQGEEDAAAVERYHEISAPRRAGNKQPARLPSGKSLVEPPVFKAGCALRDYQKVSFDWLARNARSGRNVILGDEMVRTRACACPCACCA